MLLPLDAQMTHRDNTPALHRLTFSMAGVSPSEALGLFAFLLLRVFDAVSDDMVCAPSSSPILSSRAAGLHAGIVAPRGVATAILQNKGQLWMSVCMQTAEDPEDSHRA